MDELICTTEHELSLKQTVASCYSDSSSIPFIAIDRVEEERVSFFPSKHSLYFESVYPHVDEEGNAEVTTFHSEFKGTVDYIFYSKELIKNIGYLKLLKSSVLDELHRMPNPFLPSDHVSLLALFEWNTG